MVEAASKRSNALASTVTVPALIEIGPEMVVSPVAPLATLKTPPEPIESEPDWCSDMVPPEPTTKTPGLPMLLELITMSTWLASTLLATEYVPPSCTSIATWPPEMLEKVAVAPCDTTSADSGQPPLPSSCCAEIVA